MYMYKGLEYRCICVCVHPYGIRVQARSQLDLATDLQQRHLCQATGLGNS